MKLKNRNQITIKEKGKNMKTIAKQMIGKKVIVRATVAGVHAGEVVDIDGTTIILKNAFRMWRFHTRDKSGSISDIAANGLKSDAQHMIGAKLKSVLIENPAGLEVAEATSAAYKSIEEWADKK